MLKRFYISYIILTLSAGFLHADTFGFVPDGSNYYETFSEDVDPTIQIKVDETGGNGFSVTFRLYVDYTTNVSTTEWTRNGLGSGYWKDWDVSSISWASSNQTVTGGYVNSGINYESNTVYWQITLNSSTTDATDGIYTITLPVYDDNLYEGGSSGTPETINFYIGNVIGATTLDSDKDEFQVRITDNDKIPYYHFGQSSAQSFDEGHDTNDDGNGVSFNIQAVANPTDGVVYFVGTNSYTINYTFTDVTTTSADYTDHTGGSITISEQAGGGWETNYGSSVSHDWSYRDIRVVITFFSCWIYLSPTSVPTYINWVR